MVLVDIEIAVGVYLKVKRAMLAYLRKHMVEKSQPGMYVRVSVSVEIYLCGNSCLEVARDHPALRTPP